MFLTHPELEALTGYKRPSRMIAWLRENHFVFRVAGDGYPVVSRQYAEHALGAQATPPKSRPNFRALG